MTTPTQPHPATPASAEAAYWMATLDPAQRPQMLNESMHDVGIRKKQVGEQFVAEQLDFYGWRYTLVPLFDHPPSAERGGDEQASFERWARRQSWFLDYMAESKKDGHYTDPDMRVAWEAWQWRAALAAQPAEPLFAASVAARKWQELQENGHRMTLIQFDGGKGGPGSIDPGGVVMWGAQPAAQQGEPVAWRWRNRVGDVVTDWLNFSRQNHAGIRQQVAEVGGTIEYAYATPQPAQQAREPMTAVQQRQTDIGAAIERAASGLPDCYEIDVCVERGAAWVTVTCPEAENIAPTFDGDHTLAEQVDGCIEAAIRHATPQAEQGGDGAGSA